MERCNSYGCRKIPIHYFWIDGLTEKERGHLLTRVIIDLIPETKANFHSVNFDRASVSLGPLYVYSSADGDPACINDIRELIIKKISTRLDKTMVYIWEYKVNLQPLVLF